MNYEGEKFLLKLYNELFKDESVIRADKRSGENSKNKFELLRKYLKRLEKQEKVFAGEHEELEKYLKNRYYEKYVITEEDIPDSYWELQKKIALERGYGHVDYAYDDLKHQEARILIEDQRKSLDKWINYLMKENTSYPMWVRYWAFQGMLRLGRYDKERGRFTKRSKGTTSPFIELNAEALAYTIGTVQSYYEGKDIDDEKLTTLIESGNFGKIYSYYIWKVLEDEKKNDKDRLDTNDGVWKIFKNGDADELAKSLDGKGTGWCIAAEVVADDYLKLGNIHVYFTRDKEGNYTIPRVCIRQENGYIAEVRGIEKDQNLEPEMYDITDEKLDEFEDKEEYKKKVSDMKRLTEIYNKSHNNQKLDYDDFMFLYECKGDIRGFGWVEDPRIEELRKKHPIANKKLALEVAKAKPYLLEYLSEETKIDKDSLKDIVLEIIKYNGSKIIYREPFFSVKLLEDLIMCEYHDNTNDKSIYINPELLTDKDILIEALKHTHLPVDSVSEEMQEQLKDDKDFALAVVKKDGMYIANISKKLQNDIDIILGAASNNSKALRFVSEHKDNEDVVVQLIELASNLEDVWNWMSSKFRNSKEIVLLFVRKGFSLERVPTSIDGYSDIVLESIKQNPENIKLVSLGLILNNKDIVVEAAKGDRTILKFIEEKTLGMVTRDKTKMIEVVKNDGLALKYLKDLQDDEEIVLEAVKQNPAAIKYIGKSLANNSAFMEMIDSLLEKDRENTSDGEILSDKVSRNM